MATIQIKRGSQEAVSRLVLKEGELAVALDTGNVYIGTTAGNIHINPTGGTADTASKLKNPQNFSVTGDVISPEVSFDGTQSVVLNTSLANLPGVGGSYTKVTVNSKGLVTGGSNLQKEDLPSLSANDVGAVAVSEKGISGGVATLDSSGKVPSSQLPSYVDDVREYDALESFPQMGEEGVIYVARDTNKTYRWSGSAYSIIGSDLALGETSSTAYYGDKGKQAYEHSNIKNGNPHGTTAQQIGALEESHATQKASASNLGHVKPGTGVEVDGEGNLNITDIDGGTF